MRVLIVHASKLGGTQGIAAMIANTLTESGFDAVTRPAVKMPSPDAFDAVVVGAGLYANRWHKPARKYVKRYAEALRQMPVWLFSSGPLDDTALDNLPATNQVQELMDLIGARDHVTFGGRLESDAQGFLASSMAKTMAGDWRDEDQIQSWAKSIVAALTSDVTA
ncbi:MAG: flavodoxin [Acidimicrobiia bacterium]|nr:flavodoxin [Acidimicrobiia bacterium]